MNVSSSRRSRALGFTLDQVRGRIDDISRMEGVLDEMAPRRAGGSVPECPILETLFDGEDEGVCS